MAADPLIKELFIAARESLQIEKDKKVREQERIAIALQELETQSMHREDMLVHTLVREEWRLMDEWELERLTHIV